jgi:Icc-related predicted phosphoesterase
VDLVLGCGDLPDYYLDYVVSMLNAPCLFVHGNHAQGAEFQRKYEPSNAPSRECRPQGCNIHGRVEQASGVLVAGLEGSKRYNQNPRFQYTDGQMRRMILALWPQLYWNRIRCGRYLDILITHAPPWGIHDGPDLCHQGFKAFLAFMRRFKPKYLVHGHKHVYRLDEVTQTTYHQTEVVNTYGYRILDLDIPTLGSRSGRTN